MIRVFALTIRGVLLETALGVDFGSAVFWQSSGPPAFAFTVGPALRLVHTW